MKCDLAELSKLARGVNIASIEGCRRCRSRVIRSFTIQSSEERRKRQNVRRLDVTSVSERSFPHMIFLSQDR